MPRVLRSTTRLMGGATHSDDELMHGKCIVLTLFLKSGRKVLPQEHAVYWSLADVASDVLLMLRKAWPEAKPEFLRFNQSSFSSSPTGGVVFDKAETPLASFELVTPTAGERLNYA